MGKELPACSGKDVIKALESLGYRIYAQHGSHVKLKRKYPAGDHIIVVPLHKELDKGTLKSIVRMVSKHIDASVFLAKLKKR